ncbi:HNH endonuclease [Serpentinicella sp. ANB-PHB4]|uniref:HNH endonuclease n=1 Tax=Serpentinicella sp. ANB-PHB4 TaxID=3074076 RepID=UPI002859FCE2|nr:HNH endonuclease [Serpentinicella sp. ANB-PHB4]MDR5659014.1 HNH endonuclease [Serpentinicella sp. ANB-PHB4]
MIKKLLDHILIGQYIKFYKSKEWRQTRQDVMKRDNYECQHCKKLVKYFKGECVNHIEHLKDNPMRALDKDNLVTLCNFCHNKEHPEKLEKVDKKGKIDIPERW